jgi:uncharacterized repeat protein (TIGR03803 family)
LAQTACPTAQPPARPPTNGTDFSINRHTGRETVLYRFKGNSDGSNPAAGLYQDAKGLLCGTTYVGGRFGKGTVFRLNAVTHLKTTLHDFGGERDGALGVNRGTSTIYSVDTTTALLLWYTHSTARMAPTSPPASPRTRQAPSSAPGHFPFSGITLNKGIL